MKPQMHALASNQAALSCNHGIAWQDCRSRRLAGLPIQYSVCPIVCKSEGPSRRGAYAPQQLLSECLPWRCSPPCSASSQPCLGKLDCRGCPAGMASPQACLWPRVGHTCYKSREAGRTTLCHQACLQLTRHTRLAKPGMMTVLERYAVVHLSQKMAAARNFVRLLIFRRAAKASRTCNAALSVLMDQQQSHAAEG